MGKTKEQEKGVEATTATKEKEPQEKGTKKKTSGKTDNTKSTAKQGKDGYVPRLKKEYRGTVTPELIKEFGYQSKMQVPRIEKISVSVGVGEAIQNKKLLDSAVAELELISGQRPVRTKARKSISNFKLRAGYEIGAKVSLRGAYMWEFLDRLMNVALPRVKDFRGVSPNSFDGHGNYSLGITEQIIFPEIDYDKIERVSGLNVAIVTTADTDAEARSLLAKLGMPFRK
jgi:large subunit ribosomal protein L5